MPYDSRARPCQDPARTIALSPQSGLPHFCKSLAPWKTGASRSGLAGDQFPHGTGAREVIPSGQSYTQLSLELNWVWKTFSDRGLPSQPWARLSWVGKEQTGPLPLGTYTLTRETRLQL